MRECAGAGARRRLQARMGAYDEVEIEDMSWNDKLQAYTYACPCGDIFQITLVRSGVAPALGRQATVRAEQHGSWAMAHA